MSRTRGTFEAAPNVSLTSVQVEQTPPPAMAVVALLRTYTLSLPFSALTFF